MDAIEIVRRVLTDEGPMHLQGSQDEIDAFVNLLRQVARGALAGVAHLTDMSFDLTLETALEAVTQSGPPKLTLIVSPDEP
jgi:hypothetical protein